MDEINIAELVGDAVILDISDTYGPGKMETREISLEELQRAFSKQQNQLRTGDALIIHTGWSVLYHSDPARYYDRFHTLGRAACEWAVKAGIRLFGIDAPDVDPPETFKSRPFSKPNHKLLLEKGICIIENVGGEVAELVQQRVLLIPAPLKLAGQYASGVPVRLLAIKET